jgi:LMBR1 domain-containing protein 1
MARREVVLTMNWWLIVTAVIGVLLTFGVSAYIIFILTTPSELKTAIFPKFIALLALSLAFIAVLLLPYEVANKRDPVSFQRLGGGVDTTLMWQIVLWSSAALIVIVVPFSMFFYEAYDPEQFSFVQQCTPAVLYTMGLLVGYLVIFFALFFSIGYAVIPYYAYATNPQFIDAFSSNVTYTNLKTKQSMELRTSAFVYFVGILCFIGWLLFMIYGGVGLIALPVGLSRYLYKIPKKPLTDQEFAAEKEKVAGEALMLLKEGTLLQKQGTAHFKVQVKVNQFNARVNSLENRFKRAVDMHDNQQFHYVKLIVLMFAVIISFGLTVTWFLHIFIHNIVKLNGFFNVILVELDNVFNLLGLLVYAVLVFYLLWCVVVGNVKVGLRFTFFQIHPLKYRDTRVNAILFNVGLVLTSSIAIVQFCVFSFTDYVDNTAAEALFDSWIRRLKYFGPMFPWLQIVLFGISVLSIAWVVMCPRPKPKEKKDDDDDE